MSTTQSDVLLSTLTLDSINPLKTIDQDEYWKRKLIYYLITTPIYIFPNDENSTNSVYDTITNHRVRLEGKTKKPGQRGIVSQMYSLAGIHIMEIKPMAVYYHEKGPKKQQQQQQPEFIEKWEDVLLPFLSNYIKSLTVVNEGLMYLALRVLFAYLHEEELQLKLCNLCTHQKEIRLDLDKRHLLDTVKNVIMSSIKDFLSDHELGMLALKKSMVKVTKKSWKFIEDIVSIVFINYFTLFDYRQQEIGFALDPDFSLINHSCLPNCSQIVTNTGDYKVVNTLPVMENEEFTVTYIPLGYPKEIRQFQLFQQFYFRCNCTLCKLDDDPFFGIQCNKCCSTVKSPSFKLILTAPNLGMRQHICNKCLNSLNHSVYPKNIKIRNFFISLIIFTRDGYSFNDQDFFKFLNKEFTSYIEKFSAPELIKMLSIGIYRFEIPKTRIRFVKNMIDIILTDKVFPLYTFPFNIIIRELDFMEPTGQIQTSKEAITRLKLKFQKVFGVDIPSDLTSMSMFNECLFLDVADELYQVVKFITDPDLESQAKEVSTLFGTDTLPVFCQTAFYFYKQRWMKSSPSTSA
ncbi:putative SET-like protein [Candida maltosa Xu316]|uniref:Putative SET-like protein n=1 Tax=Candida maltosa (strain Xu316) TaxID=1245528 RepID=M3K264_CANMX|nr:putative SET-like protein [Candida maltosa Xu316]